MIPDSVPRWLRAHDYGEMQAVHTVAGGCINRGVRLVTSNGQSFFLKTNSAAPADMFLREAEGLEALRVPRGPRVPRPLVHGEDFLLMEDLSPAGQSHNYWTRFGSQLAALHEQPADRFGFAHDNYIGSTVQTNSWTDTNSLGNSASCFRRVLRIVEVICEQKTSSGSIGSPQS